MLSHLPFSVLLVSHFVSKHLIKYSSHNIFFIMNISFKKYLTSIFFLLSILLCFDSFAQDVPPTVMVQVQAMLKSKGLNEDAVKARLRSKGLDVDKMSQEELIKNQKAIEQTVAEMEAEKNKNQPSQAGTGSSSSSTQGATPVANKSTTEAVVVDNVPVEVSKKEIASEALQAATAV